MQREAPDTGDRTARREPEHRLDHYPLSGWKLWTYYMMVALAVVSFAVALTTMPVVTGFLPY